LLSVITLFGAYHATWGGGPRFRATRPLVGGMRLINK
jgi:hypothetical protein